MDNSDPIVKARDILEVVSQSASDDLASAQADNFYVQRAQAWALLSIAESLAVIAARPTQRCTQSRRTVGTGSEGSDQLLVCSLPAGHVGEHVDPSGTTFARA